MNEKRDAAEWIREWQCLPCRSRIVLTICLLVGAFGGLWGGILLTSDFRRSWVAWAISLLILDPVGLACALGLIVLIFPSSLLAHQFGKTLREARRAAALVGLIVVAALLGCFLFLLVELWKMRSA